MNYYHGMTINKYQVSVLDSNEEEVMSSELTEDMSEAYSLYLKLSDLFLNANCSIQFLKFVYQDNRYLRTEVDEEKRG